MATVTGVGSSSWASQNAGTASGGPAASAEQAYRRAVKDLTRAQQQLMTHALEKAEEEVLEVDQQAVDLAAAALAQAAAELSRQRRQDVVAVAPEGRDQGGPRLEVGAPAQEVRGGVAAGTPLEGTVDTYV